MHRREFLKQMLVATAGSYPFIHGFSAVKDQQNVIQTISGSLPPSLAGFMLPHEHLFSNFGVGIKDTHIYDEVKLFKQVIPYLKQLKAYGCDTIVDCTTAYFGRRVDILLELYKQTGVHIVTNTGYYGAANDRYIPDHAYKDSAEEIAKVWIDEFENGIEDTNVKPGFIKLAVDSDGFSAIDQKLFEAGIEAHINTGLTLAVHTSSNAEAAFAQIKLLKSNNVKPGAWIWTHADKVDDPNTLVDAAREGSWISLDGIRDEASQQQHLQYLNILRDADALHRVLLSHDGNGFPSGKSIRPFHTLFTAFIPLLLKHGYTREEVDMLTRTNPHQAFTIQVRS